MAVYYLDASAAVKGYVAEVGSGVLTRLFENHRNHRLYMSRVGMVEVAAGISSKVKSGELRSDEAEFAVGRLLQDVEDFYRIVEVRQATAELAVKIALDHRLRAYDCLQLATAFLMQRQRGLSGLEPLVLLSSDSDLNDAARREGLTVEDPVLQAAGADDADEEEEAEDGGDDEAGEAEDADAE